MRGKYRPHHILEVVLLFIVLAGFSASNSKANENSKYLDAVREFADNVLKYGRDTYGPKHTPLFVDGLNIHTHEPVKWIAPNGDRWILSNLASQQNLFRTLDGLTKVTGDPKYRQAAMEAIEYAFENLRSPNGLLYWGNGTAYDAQGEKACGWRVGDPYAHCLKANLPYYELMWQVNPEATKAFIESFWSAHVIDWSSLAMNRTSQFCDELEIPWRHEYRGGPTFLESGSGQSFFNAGTDLVYAAVSLTKLSGDKEPLVWAKRLIQRYVRTRHPKTGISYWMYTKPKWKVREQYDDIMRRLVPGTTEFMPSEFPWFQYTNSIFREASRGQFTPTPGISVHKPVFYWQAQFLVGEMLDGDGKDFKQWALEELTAFGKTSYRKEDNVYVPMLTDGTKLEGYVVKEDGPLGPKGVVSESVPVGSSDFWAYTMGYRVTRNEFMWEMAHSIAKGNKFGDLGVTPKDKPRLNFDTDYANPYALLAFLELNRATCKRGFLEMAKRIGDNILGSRFYKGFFVASNKHIYTKFDAVDSLALLHLYSALFGDTAVIPQVWPSLPYFTCPYRNTEITLDNTILYTLTGSSEAPLSFQEVAAEGDLEEIRAMISRGADVNGREGPSKKTALHRAAMGGHKDVAELLLAKGADIDAGKFDIGTALRYAAEKGHKEIAELLIAHGADVNAKSVNGQTPLDIAANRNRKDIVELLVAKGADVSLHTAARFGDLAIVESLIEKGTDIDAKDASGQTPLHHAAEGGHKDVVELLIANDANVNAKDNDGNTPWHVALDNNNRSMLELLIAKGANFTSIHLSAYQGDLDQVRSFIDKGVDVNAKNKYGETPLHKAVGGGHKDVAALLIYNGSDVNAKGRWDYTPIYYAAWSRNTEMIELLIEEGADVNAKDRWGWTPLHYMAQGNYKDMAELLIAKGADVNAEDDWGETPLQVAEDKGHTEIAELLRKHGAKEEEVGKEEESSVSPPTDINKKAYAYQMPLHKAAAEADFEKVKSLISDGVDANAESNEGWTALHRAAVFGHADVVKFLLSHGAEPNTVNRWGWTPLHSAVLYGHKAVVELLLANGADISAKTPAGETPMQISIERGYKEIAELLRKPGVKKDKSPQTAPK